MLEPARVTRAQRELAALARQVGEDDPEAFAELVRLRDHLDAVTAAAAARQQARGYSWAELARPLGVTRQAAFQRFGRRAPAGDLTPTT